MSIYVLIIWVSVFRYGTAIDHLYYLDRASCESGAALVKKEGLAAFCVPADRP